MASYICSQLKKCMIFFFFALLPITGGCMGNKINVEVVVFNYTERPIAEITVQDQYMGGFYQAYGPGGTGGGIYCCIDVTPGEAEVKWEVGWPVKDPLPPEGINRVGSSVIPKPNGPYKYLGIHIYPDEKVEFTLTRDIPPEKKEGVH